MTGIIYPIVRKYIDNEINFEQSKQQFVHADMSLVKRQMTWFRSLSECRFLPVAEPFEVVAVADKITRLF